VSPKIRRTEIQTDFLVFFDRKLGDKVLKCLKIKAENPVNPTNPINKLHHPVFSIQYAVCSLTSTDPKANPIS